MNAIELDLTNYGVVNFYPYRTARVSNWGIKITMTPSDHNHLREYMIEQGYKLDNHVTWTMSNGLVFTYSDRTLYIGTSVKEVNW